MPEDVVRAWLWFVQVGAEDLWGPESTLIAFLFAGSDFSRYSRTGACEFSLTRLEIFNTQRGAIDGVRWAPSERHAETNKKINAVLTWRTSNSVQEQLWGK